MIEINFIVLEDALNEKAVRAVTNAFNTTLQRFVIADRQYQRIATDVAMGKPGAAKLKEYEDRLNKSIDAAFSSFVILHKEYKRKTGARLFDGGIGVSKAECTEEEWASFRSEKAEMLDEVATYFMLRLEQEKAM